MPTSVNSLTKTHPHVAAAWHPTRNGTLRPCDVSAGMSKKVWWFCPKTCSGGCPHEWEAPISTQIRPTAKGCPHCQPRSHRVCIHRSIVTTHPHVAVQWHPTLNGDVTPDQVLAGSTKKYWWLCPATCPEECPHVWDAFVSNRCKGEYGCPYCSSLTKRVCVHTSIVGTHPDVAAQWHPTKNGDLRPENFSYGSERNVWWLCSKTCPFGCPHEWKTEIAKRILRGADAGCPYCASNHKSTCVHTSIVTTHPRLLEEWDYEKNTGIKPEECVAGCCERVWWKCKTPCTHGCEHRWRARISDRTRGNTGCPYCCEQRQKFCIHQSLQFTHPEIASEWHPEKNGEMVPSQFVSGSIERIWWRCNVNSAHEWDTRISMRTSNRSGCPYCTNKTEGKLFTYLTTHYPDTICQFSLSSCKRIKRLRFDFCIPSLKTIIEMDGVQHFKQVSNWLDPEETLQRDVFKTKKAEEAGYKVIRILQQDVYHATDEWLDKNLNVAIQCDERDHTYISTRSDQYVRHIELYSSGKDVILHV